MSWKTIKLADLCTVITKGTTPSNIGESFTETGVNYIRSEMITDAKYISSNGMLYISDGTHEKLKRSQLKKDDILFSMAGVYLGKTAILREEDVPANTNQAVALIRIDLSKCNLEYVYYFLNLPETVAKVNTVSGQAAQPNINLKQIGNIEIILPDIETQNRISTILSAYDDLIENNQKQIKLLEEAAQRLYKEWFVDLRFPGHENTPIIDGVPMGWRKGSADSFFEITIGKTPPRAESRWFTDGKAGIPWVSISDMGATSTFLYETAEGLTIEAISHHNVKLIPANTVLLSFKLTVGRVAITTKDMCTNEAIAHFKMVDPAYREYVYCYLKDYHYDSLGSTSSISKAVNSKIIKAMPFVVPNYELVETFSKTVAPIFEQIKNKQKSCLELKQARDRLLPKLMSGEIDIDEKKDGEIYPKIKKLSFNEFLNELGLAARAKTIFEEDLKAMYEAYLDDDATE